ncbi:sugar phosphate isomerase/epimerase family protein [Maribacter sp. 2-571]|uniref:sugar phosphate isomerase/epimerase family protein n=1 Tax=Maribacter sp. 2-571 TaxID=3417569 RepID=UPI003D3500FE
MEPHINGYISDSNGYLLFKSAVADSNIKVNVDTGWSSMQAEYPEFLIYKLKDDLEILQVRDVDNTTRTFTRFGEGIVNYDQVLTALKQIDFKGYLSFEEVFFDTAKEDAANFLKYVEKWDAR